MTDKRPCRDVPNSTARMLQTWWSRSVAHPMLARTGCGLATVLLSVALVGCQANVPADAAPAESPASGSAAAIPRVEVVTVEKRDLSRTIEMPGTVQGYETVDLYAKLGGYLGQLHVDIGDKIVSDQELARLDVPELHRELQQREAQRQQAVTQVAQFQAAVHEAQAEHARSQAELEEAKIHVIVNQAEQRFRKIQFERVRKLVDRGSLQAQMLDEARFRLESAEAALAAAQAHVRTAEAQRAKAVASAKKAQRDLESAQAGVEVAQAAYERIKTLLDYTVIRAPFDGVVIKRWADPGAFIQPAEGNSAARPLLTVSRIDRVRVFIDLPMDQVRFLDRGDRATLDRITVLPDKHFEGKVARFAEALDETSRTMRVEIDLDNADRLLLPGYYGYVTLYLEEFPATPIVPASAVMTDGDTSFVLVVEEGRVRKQTIEAIYRDGVIVGVSEGLEAHQQVVRAGGGQLRDGQQVVPIDSSAPTP